MSIMKHQYEELSSEGKIKYLEKALSDCYEYKAESDKIFLKTKLFNDKYYKKGLYEEDYTS